MQRCIPKGALWQRMHKIFGRYKHMAALHLPSLSAVHRSPSSLLTGSERESESTLSFATCQADNISQAQQYQMPNLVQGEWQQTSKYIELVHPLNAEKFIRVTPKRTSDHIDNLLTIPGARLESGGKPLQNHTIPEVYGALEPTAVFVPLKETLKDEESSSLVTTEISGPFQILTEYKHEDIPLLLEPGERMHAHLTAAVVSNDPLFLQAEPETTLLTGSSKVAEKLAVDLKGLVKLEDAGFDRKIPGPDVKNEDHVAWTCDQDAYACRGQKCSAQSILFAHENWAKTCLVEVASLRKLENLTVGPVLTVTPKRTSDHIDNLLTIPGARLESGGKPLQNHTIPEVYGALEPTAVFVPLKETLKDEESSSLVTTEISGPFQILTEYKHEDIPLLLEPAERLHAHLTAAVVSNDPLFLQEDHVAWTCDQDAYACRGQKCSAQSILFAHENSAKTCLVEVASLRKLEDLTVGPVLTVTPKRTSDHIDNLLTIPGARLESGGKPLQNHTIPEVYGALEPTAVFVPLKETLKDEESFSLVTTEIFGPFQILTEYKHEDIPLVLEACERMHAHLTAAVVCNDPLFLQEILSNTVNGTTYAGIRARTTGAPQNHWFGPAGDPRGAGIGTPEAIKLVWSCHREIIQDIGPILNSWKTPPCS